MKTLRFLVLAVVVSSASLVAGNSATSQKDRTGAWARGGTSLWLGAPPVAIVSPDSAMTVMAHDSEMTVAGPSIPSRTYEIYSLSEILWAPDSQAFAVTSSEGGWVGTWSVTVYWKNGSITNPSPLALRSFKRDFPKCPEEFPNVAAVGWAHGSRNLRVIVEMPCHSSCSDMCKFRGYVVDSTNGNILERLSEDAVKRRWASLLGERKGAR